MIQVQIEYRLYCVYIISGYFLSNEILEGFLKLWQSTTCLVISSYFTDL